MTFLASAPAPLRLTPAKVPALAATLAAMAVALMRAVSFADIVIPPNVTGTQSGSSAKS